VFFQFGFVSESMRLVAQLTWTGKPTDWNQHDHSG